MQFKLLNFHKFVGNFASSLVGTFIPLIIYKATGSIRLAVLFIFGQCFVRLLSNHIFKKLYNNYPQLTLLIRVVPMLVYNISLIFLEDFMVVGIILVILSYGVSLSLKNNATGVILNYSSRKDSAKKITLTRIVEAVSAMVAAVTGGLFIDWSRTWLIVFSLSLYIISVIPLIIYFILNKRKKGFNKDFTSNVAIVYDKDPVLKQKRKSIVKNFIFQYFMFYMIFCVIDTFTTMYSLHLFVSVPTFAQAGYLSAVFQFAGLIGVLLIDVINKKFDLNTANLICGLLCAVPLGVIPFLQNYIAIYSLIFVFGFAYAICSYFMMNSLMSKCKIISANNRALMARQDGIMVGQMVTPVIIMIFGTITPVFFVMVGALVVYSFYTFIVEKRLRKTLVDYIENNEIE